MMVISLIYGLKAILVFLVAIEGLVGILTYIYDHVLNKKLIGNEDKVLFNPRKEDKEIEKLKNLKELKAICQKSYILGYGIYSIRLKIIKFFSIRLTSLLIKTPITPNQITLFTILLGFLSGIFFSLGNYWFSLIAVLLLPLYLILDAVDGEIARYKKMSSSDGDFIDGVAHLILAPTIYSGITIGVFKTTNNIIFLILGISLILFSMFVTTLQPIKNSKFLYKLINISKGKYVNEIKKRQPSKGIESIKLSLFKKIFKRTYPFLRFAFIEYLIAIAALFNLLPIILVFFGIIYPFLWIIFFTNEIKKGTSDLEYLIGPYIENET